MRISDMHLNPAPQKVGEKTVGEGKITMTKKEASEGKYKLTPGSSIFNMDTRESFVVNEVGEIVKEEVEFLGFEELIEIMKTGGHRYPTKMRYKPIMQTHNKDMAASNKKVWGEANEVLEKFFSGKATTQEVKDIFLRGAKENLEANKVNGFICKGNAKEEESKVLQEFYSEFRHVALSNAVRTNNAEGMALSPAQKRGDAYYNSDYYYQSESIIKEVEKTLSELSNSLALGEIELPDYTQSNFDLYNNFTSAWAPRIGPGPIRFIDSSVPPPRDFKMSYYLEGDQDEQTTYGLTLISIGETVTVPFEEHVGNILGKDFLEKEKLTFPPEISAWIKNLEFHNELWMRGLTRRLDVTV